MEGRYDPSANYAELLIITPFFALMRRASERKHLVKLPVIQLGPTNSRRKLLEAGCRRACRGHSSHCESREHVIVERALTAAQQ